MIRRGVIPQLAVSSTLDHVYVAGPGVRQSVRLNADGFFSSLLSLPSQRCIDLLRIAAGAYAVDRIFKRTRSELGGGIRHFSVSFEVRDLPFWRRKKTRQATEEILSFLTGDYWSLEFSRATGELGHQDYLPLPKFKADHVALYSGGLDSAAGLAHSILQGTTRFLLVTIGHQSALHPRVAHQLQELQKLLGSRASFEILQSTLTTSLEQGKSRRVCMQEQSQRSRGFLFCAAAAVAAEAYQIDRIKILENGVGSVNLPLMTGMFGNGCASRGAHPTFLRMMSEFVHQVSGCALKFELPFLAQTKAEMLQPLTKIPGLVNWLQTTRSCVHTSLRKAGKTHCGCCPACIERRQAFASAAVSEDLDRYVINAFVDTIDDEEKATYLRLCRLDAMRWVKGDPLVDRRLIHHLALTEIPTEQHDDIRALHVRYARETLRNFGAMS